MIPTNYYLLLSAILFGLGIVAFVFKRNIITIFMAIELMLNAVNLTFLAFARYGPVTQAKSVVATVPHNVWQTAMAGQMIVIFVMAVAAAEVAVGLGIIMAIFRLRQSIDIDEMSLLRG